MNSLNFDVPDDDDREVIHAGALAHRRRANATRWGFLLVAFMRICAGLWLLLGLMHWTRIILPGPESIEAIPVAAGIVISVFAVADVVAAVGLWLAEPWGGVLWALTVVGEMAAIWLMPVYFIGGHLLLPPFAVLLLVYFALTWLAARQRRQM